MCWLLYRVQRPRLPANAGLLAKKNAGRMTPRIANRAITNMTSLKVQIIGGYR